MRRAAAIASFCLFSCLLASNALAVQPSISRMIPQGFQRGKETELTITGARLKDAQELMFYSPGIEVKQLTAEADNKLKIMVSVAADCRIGIHALRLRTATGITAIKTFTIGALPEVAEKEPNSSFDTPQAVAVNSTVSGVVANEDVDYFVIDAKKGDRITAELEGLRLGNTFFDPYLAILNSERFELSQSDDHALLYQDCLCSIVAPEDGKYTIMVRESAYGGSSSSTYRLHIGSFPRPIAVIPAGGKPGEKLKVKWIGDASGDFETEVTLPTATGEQGIYAEDKGGISPSPNMVRVIDLDNHLEVEPNNDRNTATAATVPAAFNGIIQEPGDMDYFKFTAKKGQAYNVRVYARKTLRSPLDSVLYVQRSTGANVSSNDDSGGPDSYVRFTAPADDEYRIAIRDHLKSGGPEFVYRIEVTPDEKTLALSLPEVRRYIATADEVPAGNRMAVMVNAARSGFGGDLNLDISGLPPGMHVEAPVMAANRNDVVVLVSAKPDASPAGALANLTAKPVDEKVAVEGKFKQRTMLVRGQNNRDVWGHDAERVAVALTAAAPFEIEIVQPKVPVTRNGSLGLKVIARRAEGFTAAIAVRMLYNPPGIGSSGSISIPAGKNEAIIPITANGGAAIAKWPIVVTGRASHSGGNITVSTQMAELEIVDRYFDFAFDKAAGELGQDTEVVVKMTKKSDFPETAKVVLLGLPAKTATPAEGKEVKQDTTEIVFPVKIEEGARVGRFKSLVARATIVRNGETITTTLGGGELRVDKPIPPKVEVAAKPKPKPAAKPAPKPAAPAAKPVKRLSRLEQLRLDRENARKAAGG